MICFSKRAMLVRTDCHATVYVVTALIKNLVTMSTEPVSKDVILVLKETRAIHVCSYNVNMQIK